MAYSTIKYGSSGDDVKTLQTYLNNNGYKLDVDGQFGSKTQAAVKDYQSKNNLSVDGIVGKNTWGSLSSSKNTASKSTSNNSSAAATASRPTYTKSDTLTEAEKTLAEWEAAKPAGYQSQYSDDINALLDSILNGTYDPNNDELFNIYKEQYEKNGKLAMQDTMAQAAAYTGGYGSSYGTAAAQQTYQQYLTELNNMIPELAEQSRNSKIQNLSLLQQQDDSDYGKYRDSVDDYYTQGNYLYQKAADISDEEWQKYLQLVDEYEYDQAFDYQKERDKVADEQWQKSYELSKASASKSSGGSSSGSSGGKTPTTTMVSEAKELAKSGDKDAFYDYIDTCATAGYNTSSLEALMESSGEIEPTFTQQVGDFMSRYATSGKSEVNKQITSWYKQGLLNENEVAYLYDWLDEKFD